MFNDDGIPAAFIRYAADILGDTASGLSGGVIVSETAAYAADFDVDIPHAHSAASAPNKRTALYENLMAFDGPQQYKIIKDLCDHRSFPIKPDPKRKELRIRLISRYGHLDSEDERSEVNDTLVEETRHWLSDFSDALSLYNDALQMYDQGIYQRNILDNLRLSLERLLRSIFGNNSPLEKQISNVGTFIKSSGGSIELSNMFARLLDYYGKYQNSYVKHDANVKEQEVEFVIEITSSFMKHLVRLHADA